MNRVQFQSVDLLPVFGKPIYIQHCESQQGTKQHANALLVNNDTGKSVNDDVATRQVAWKTLIYSQLESMSGLIGLETELKLQESYVNRLKQGQSLHLLPKNDRILTGVWFIEEPKTQMIWTDNSEQWFAGLDLKFGNENLVNSNEFQFTPTEGNFCLYPSSMTLSIGHTGNNVSILEFYLK